MADQIAWRETDHGAVPVSTRFEDPYYSLAGGLDETGHVFLAGNDLPARFGGAFAIAELGFGTGLNALATWAAWRDAGARGSVTFTSFEAFPLDTATLARALAAFPALDPLAARLVVLWTPDGGRFALDPGFTLEVVIGDARDTVPGWDGTADAWFLDGFSPARNPDLWEPALLRAVAERTAPGGTAATYSAAGHVRRALAAAGFTVTRAPGYGRKRHMTRARLG